MMNTTSESLKASKTSIFQHISFYEQLKIHAQLRECSGRVLDSRPKGHMLEPHCVVVLEQDTFILA